MIDIKAFFIKIMETLADKVSKRGDTMSGSLTIRSQSTGQWGGASVAVYTQNGTASGHLTAGQTGNFGLWDLLHKKWLIRTNAAGRVVVNLTAASLYSTAYHPTNVGTAYYYVTVNDIAYWNCIAVVGHVKNHRQVLFFFRGITTGEQHITVTHGGTFYRGGFTVDWTNKKVGVRCLEGDAGDDAKIYNIVGIF